MYAAIAERQDRPPDLPPSLPLSFFFYFLSLPSSICDAAVAAAAAECSVALSLPLSPRIVRPSVRRASVCPSLLLGRAMRVDKSRSLLMSRNIAAGGGSDGEGREGGLSGRIREASE